MNRTPIPPTISPTPPRRRDLWGLLLLSVYLLALVWVVIFKANLSLPTVRPERVLNLIPFYYEQVGDMDNPFIEAELNVLVFIPLGAYLAMLGVRWYRTILGGFALSLLFEITQLAFAIGVADVTDLITNTVGSAIGLGVYTLLRRLCRARRHFELAVHMAATICTGVVVVVVVVLIILVQ